ncbi:MAG TPA: aldolase [Clostridiales bacterium]|nr:aldolase [Clostridiales bacterium]
MDIMFIKAGDQGEKNVYYELKNSFIPMLVLHDVVIQYDEYKAQMDYILITQKFICILETKKLNGNITINADGDFVRTFVNKSGKAYKKEGMYSPISQNQRHVRILDNLLKQERIIRHTPILSLVVVANPKSIIDFKFAKKDIREQIVKYDQLTPRIKKMLSMKSEVDLSDKSMTKIANFLAEKHVECESAFLTKYRQHENKVDLGVDQNPTSNQTEEAPASGSPVERESMRIALTKFRLDKSREEQIKAYYIFNNNQMEALLDRMPSTTEDLFKCDGFGPVKVEKYGEQILKILRS